MTQLFRRQFTRELRSVDTERAKQQKARDGIHAVLSNERRQAKLPGGIRVGLEQSWVDCVQLKFWHPSGITSHDIKGLLDTLHGWGVVKTRHPYGERVDTLHWLSDKQVVVTLRRTS